MSKNLIFVCVMFALQTNLHSQYTVQQGVFTGGSATAVSDACRLAGSAGQTAAGVAGSSAHTVRAGFWYQTAGLLTGVEHMTEEVPKEFRLEQNYPNPFNPNTTIRIALPKASHVTLRLYDILGREVMTLVNANWEPGVHKVTLDARTLPAGVYFYRAVTEETSRTRKLTIIK